ncbi:uncharacterized protein ASCRUDRAFT_76619 [Ascoidea rubescens DSM 1968]|uniref:Uncharacterized protein n=1 Tax=Ascoidea rubescens DSM 1968 TaxID=1344418 RepID=A0A1D2VF59_9ASCO|nr:hypothetical protein ASCRUDRAFT_76619 [Ascoidea rubescens DSM 1968]ODV60107.1 hypothetical protein ASCRUDRAFT_76619 [Ascoidea rubescens DSM 1968]
MMNVRGLNLIRNTLLKNNYSKLVYINHHFIKTDLNVRSISTTSIVFDNNNDNDNKNHEKNHQINSNKFKRLAALTNYVNNIISKDSKNEIIQDSLIIETIKICNDQINSDSTNSNDELILNDFITKLLNLKSLDLNLINFKKLVLLNNVIENYHNKNFKVNYTFINQLITSYQKQNPTRPLPNNLITMIIRFSLFENNIEESLKIVDKITTEKNYINTRKTKMWNSVGITVGGLFGVSTTIELVANAFFKEYFFGVHNTILMLVPYLLNISILYSIMKINRNHSTGNVSVLKYKDGTAPTYSYIYLNQMKFYSIIFENDRKINSGLDKDPRKAIVNRLVKNNFVPLPNEEDLLVDEYWITKGENFEWMDPDQDPAEIIYRNYLKDRKLAFLPNNTSTDNKSLDWTRELLIETPKTQ